MLSVLLSSQANILLDGALAFHCAQNIITSAMQHEVIAIGTQTVCIYFSTFFNKHFFCPAMGITQK